MPIGCRNAGTEKTEKVVSPIDYHKWMSEIWKKQQEKAAGNCFSRFLLQRQTPFSHSFGRLVRRRPWSPPLVLLARLNWSHHCTPRSPQVLFVLIAFI
jgi:hypothetical protein